MIRHAVQLTLPNIDAVGKRYRAELQDLKSKDTRHLGLRRNEPDRDAVARNAIPGSE